MAAPVAPLRKVLRETIAVVERVCGDDLRLRDFAKTIRAAEVVGDPKDRPKGSIPAHATLLDTAISSMPDTPFASLKAALSEAKDCLTWRVDDGLYYAQGADVGDGYRTGNMHCLLFGPENSVVRADDFLLGFFLLAPRTLYRDHYHLAPELYIPLTGPSGWRFERGAWRDHEPGEVVFNPPEVIHATRVYDVPFLSIFAWSQDVDARCHVAESDDWAEIETGLNSR